MIIGNVGKVFFYLFLVFQDFISKECLSTPDKVKSERARSEELWEYGKTLKPRELRAALVTFAV